MENKIIRGSHVLYLVTITPIVCILVYPPPPPPPLEGFICGRRVSDNPGAQPNPPHIFKTLLPVYYSI